MIIQDYQNRINLNSRQDEFRVMCIGDSMTYEGGEEAYPIQLESVLNASVPTRHFKVINKGVPGSQGDLIEMKFPQWISEYQPQMVVVMLGLFDSADNDQQKTSIGIDLVEQKLSSLRIYKLGQGVWKNLCSYVEKSSLNCLRKTKQISQEKPVISAAEDMKQRGDRAPKSYIETYVVALMAEGDHEYEKAAIIFRKLTEANVDPILTAWMERGLAENLRLARKYDEFVTIMKRRVKEAWMMDTVWQMYRDDKGREQIYKTLMSLIAENPKDAKLYEILGTCYAAVGKNKEAQKCFAQEAKLKGNGIPQSTMNRLRRIWEILREQNTILVISQYPLRDVFGYYQAINDFLEKDRIIIVDNQKVFQEALNNGKYEDYFKDRTGGIFGHCTLKGNKILGGNIARVIKEYLSRGR